MAIPPQKVVRQATEFVDRLGALEQLPRPHLDGVDTVAGAIDQQWAVPALVAAWDATLAGREFAAGRPEIKRALVSVLRHSQSSGSRATGDLFMLLGAAHEAYATESELFVGPWNSALEAAPEQDRSLYLRIAGDELQTAPDAAGLVRFGLINAITRLAEILDGSVAPAALADIAPVLSRVPVTAITRDLWFGVYMRLAVLVSIELLGTGPPDGGLIVLPQRFYNQASLFAEGEMLGTVSATAEDIRRVLSSSPAGINGRDAESVITMFPLHESGPHYVTSARLVVDSIATWILRQVHDLKFWKSAVSLPFEQKIIATLQEHGFTAGPVKENGHWKTDNESAATKNLQRTLEMAESKPPGEIDVLAYRKDGLFLIEAKSILGLGRNVTDRLGPADLEAWRSKLQAKARWLSDQGLQPDLTCIVLEGVGYLSGTEANSTVPIVPLALFDDIVGSVGYPSGTATVP
jgi:hypothetical protein